MASTADCNTTPAVSEIRILRLAGAAGGPTMKAEIFRDGVRLGVLLIRGFPDLSAFLSRVGVTNAAAAEAIRALEECPSVALEV